MCLRWYGPRLNETILMAVGFALTPMTRSSHARSLTVGPPALSRQRIGPVILIVLIVFVVFGRVIGNNFLWWDDEFTIFGNEAFKPVTLHGIFWHWRHPFMQLYVPMTYTIWGLLASVAGPYAPDPQGITLDPAVFHAASLLVHTLNALLVLALLQRLTQRTWAALLGALLFALHPVQVETVAWASGLKDLMAAGCVMGFMLCYLQGVEGPASPWRRPAYYAAGLLLLLGMLCKPSAMVGPVLAGVLEWQTLRRPLRSVLQHSLPPLLLVSPLVVVAKLVQPAPLAVPVSSWLNPLVATDALAFYLWKLVCPLHLSVVYGRTPAFAWQMHWPLWTWIVPALVLAAMLLWRRRQPVLLAAGLLFVAALAPVLGLTHFEFQNQSTVADHYLYVPMFAVAWLAAAWLATLQHRRALASGITALILMLLALRSFTQLGYWRDDMTLWTHAVQVSPQSPFVNYNLGLAYSRPNPPDLQGCLGYYQKAVALDPGYVDAQNNLALALLGLKRMDEGIVEMKQTIRLLDKCPTTPTASRVRAFSVLAQALLDTNRATEAVSYYQKALAIDPNYAIARSGLTEAQVRARAATQPAAQSR